MLVYPWFRNYKVVVMMPWGKEISTILHVVWT